MTSPSSNHIPLILPMRIKPSIPTNTCLLRSHHPEMLPPVRGHNTRKGDAWRRVLIALALLLASGAAAALAHFRL